MVSHRLAETETHMRKTLEALKRELAGLRSGRARPGLVENLRVDYYGVPTPLHQIAGISVPDPRLILIQPWDRTVLPAIEKALLKSDLGLNPSNDGSIIRIVVPPLTEERRRELVKVLHKKLEENRVALRNIRRDALEGLRRLQKEKQISEDEMSRGQEQLQKLTDSFMLQVDQIGKDKEAELLEI